MCATTLQQSNRQISILPPASKNWNQIEQMFQEDNLTSVITQGQNTCAFDVTMFIIKAFGIFRIQRDVDLLDEWKKQRPSQFVIRLISRITWHHLNLETRRRIADMYISTICAENNRLNMGDYNDLTEVLSLTLEGVPCMSYTHSEVYKCCGKFYRGPNTIYRQMTAHQIMVISPTVDCDNDNHPTSANSRVLPQFKNKTIAKVFQEVYFPESSASDSNLNDYGHMNSPFDPCNDSCCQLPQKLIEINPGFPAYFLGTISLGSPWEHNKTRKYTDMLRIRAYVTPEKRVLRAIYRPVVMALYMNNHFVATAYNPPHISGFKDTYCYFDGMIPSGSPRKAKGLISGRKDHSICAIIYLLAEVSSD